MSALPLDISRRRFLRAAGAGAFVAGLPLALPMPAWARAAAGLGAVEASARYDLDIAYSPIVLDGRKGTATGINGTVPGPLVRLREGDLARLNVRNSLDADSSIHWHGILLPPEMDGVPGLSFRGIAPGDTFRYRYRVGQAGTYWYHSHSRFQEQTGTYGPLIIDPQKPEPFGYERDHVVVLSDWSFEDPETVFRNINLHGDFYNARRATLGDFFDEAEASGFGTAWATRRAWGEMRMESVDLADVSGLTYTYLMNGLSPDMNWTGLFDPGETIRLRFINAAAMSNFDVRIPGLDMTVVMADGKLVQPARCHEFRIGVAETYDVLVCPTEARAWTVFAESVDRSGYARGTLAPEEGMRAAVPAMRKRPVRTLESVGMAGMLEGGHGGHGGGHSGHGGGSGNGHAKHSGHGNGHGNSANARVSTPERLSTGENNPNVAMMVHNPADKLGEPGVGLGEDGWKVLTYADLKSAEPQPYPSEVDREMTIHITANMERYMFSFDGKKFTEHEGPYVFRHNERLRLWLVNHTMMEHPIHLHGMWMHLENGGGDDEMPYKHTLLLKPAEKLAVKITPVEKGDWAFHCHLLYHMEAGMFQVVRVV